MKKQNIFNSYQDLYKIMSEGHYKMPLIVCDNHIINSFLMEYITSLKINCAIYNSFTPNPKYEEVLAGIEAYISNNCDFIIAVGGGSALDVAKCINLFLPLDKNINYLDQGHNICETQMLAIPTTAGTGSESTRYAVIYYNDVKQSITSDSIIPDFVILEPRFLETLPEYQKKSTVMDALCQAIESYWSVNSTDESKIYAKESIELILQNIDAYLKNDNSANASIMLAANLSGRAINITQTTAAHAMSYKITSMYGISHGHAVALCLPHIWEYMINNIDKCIDKRGEKYLESIFDELNRIFEGNALELFEFIFKNMEFKTPSIINQDELNILVTSVNPIRLGNNPVSLDEMIISNIYAKILKYNVNYEYGNWRK